MESHEDYRAAVEGLRRRAHRECESCRRLMGELDYWLKELHEAQTELRELLKSYGAGGVLEDKRRALEKGEFVALERLDELIEELKGHLEVRE